VTVTQPRPPASAPATTFDSTEPATGALVATFPVDGPAEVAAALARARAAAGWWQELGYDGRAQRLRAVRGVFARRLDELVELVHRENGKPRDDAFLEIALVFDHLGWAAAHARRVLGPRRVRSPLLLANQAAVLEYQPLGVVGVIGPWNYPVFTPMGSIAYALAAGNTVVFKPSEYTPAVGRLLADLVAEAVPEQPVLSVVTGSGATGAALCGSGVDKIAFTGSAATGRAVMAACAQTLTPVVLELGGKDALVVDADADVPAAARAAVWGGIANAGQTCIGIERVYVADAVYDRFVREVVRAAEPLQVGRDLGPITMPGQVDVIARHLDDAFARGARAVVGNRDAVAGSTVAPVVLVDVPDDALVLTEETFGPVLPVLRVRDAEEGVAKANATRYGLGGSVWTRSRRRGFDLARRLRSGMTSVNSVLTFAGVPGLPFGGIGDSGFGRVHGEDGLREFSRAKAITRQRFAAPVDLLSFDRSATAVQAVRRLVRLRYGHR
jgi:acyl-CoA reductase-like NAD-dependent aldehyde dehydrogenase